VWFYCRIPVLTIFAVIHEEIESDNSCVVPQDLLLNRYIKNASLTKWMVLFGDGDG
jgi:hypothetical protein